MNEADRIRLAEAMGLDPHEDGEYGSGKRWEFEPFDDANDDYAVLEWARTSDCAFRFIEALMELYAHKGAHMYEVGDYARAALRVLDK